MEHSLLTTRNKQYIILPWDTLVVGNIINPTKNINPTATHQQQNIPTYAPSQVYPFDPVYFQQQSFLP
jgi:hypothetical protein